MTSKKLNEQLLDYDDDDDKGALIKAILKTDLIAVILIAVFSVNELYFKIEGLSIPIIVLLFSYSLYARFYIKKKHVVEHEILSIDLKKKYVRDLFYISSLALIFFTDLSLLNTTNFHLFFTGIIIIQVIDLIINKNKLSKLIVTKGLILELDEKEQLVKKIVIQKLKKIKLTNKQIKYYKKIDVLSYSIKEMPPKEFETLKLTFIDVCKEHDIPFTYTANA